MRSEDLTRDQATELGEKISPVVGYLYRLIRRMDECHFPPDDKLRQLAAAAFDKVHTSAWNCTTWSFGEALFWSRIWQVEASKSPRCIVSGSFPAPSMATGG